MKFRGLSKWDLMSDVSVIFHKATYLIECII